MDDRQIAAVSHALGNPTRVRILRLLAEQDACMGSELFRELPLAQSTVSQHLSVLKAAGLIRATRKGTSQVYCITPGPLSALADDVRTLVESRPVCTGEEA